MSDLVKMYEINSVKFWVWGSCGC